MDSPITYLATLVGALVLLLVLTGGNFHRFGLALSCFRKVARDAPFAEAVQRLLVPPPKKDEPPPKPSGAPLRLLALLQRREVEPQDAGVTGILSDDSAKQGFHALVFLILPFNRGLCQPF